MAELLLELFSEEIPARMQQNAANDLKRLMISKLEQENISYGTIQAFCAMRRLVLMVDNLPLMLADSKVERKGPRTDAAPAAIEGFCKSVGQELTQLEVREIANSKFYFSAQIKQGIACETVLIRIINEILTNFPWPKSMKWGDHQITWIRPLKNILALFNEQVIAVSYGHVIANNTSFGHRFLASASFTVNNTAEYLRKLRENFVILNPEERKTLIYAKIAELMQNQGIVFGEDEQLLNEVIGLVEYPYPMLGRIEARFLTLPREVIITAMRTHQKYFATYRDGQLSPYFVVVANINGDGVAIGNEKVLRARLADAEFFYEQDLKKNIHHYASELDKVTYHNQLGTMLAKTQRIAVLSIAVANTLGYDVQMVKQAAELCKADLVSTMVAEFPELQGVMGGYYASAAGCDSQVANAIKLHYKPQGPQDECPTESVAIAVSLADKLDSIVGLFMIGEKPTGSKDPFALRRAALGIIRIILENKLTIKLKPLFRQALENYGKISEDVTEELLAFFQERFKYLQTSLNISKSNIETDDLLLAQAKIDAILQLYQSEDASLTINNFKRVINIVAQEEQKTARKTALKIDEALFCINAEKILYQSLQKIQPQLEEQIANNQFGKAITLLRELTTPIENFFTTVVVNCAERELKENRFALLANIGILLQQIANFEAIDSNT